MAYSDLEKIRDKFLAIEQMVGTGLAMTIFQSGTNTLIIGSIYVEDSTGSTGALFGRIYDETGMIPFTIDSARMIGRIVFGEESYSVINRGNYFSVMRDAVVQAMMETA